MTTLFNCEPPSDSKESLKPLSHQATMYIVNAKKHPYTTPYEQTWSKTHETLAEAALSIEDFCDWVFSGPPQNTLIVIETGPRERFLLEGYTNKDDKYVPPLKNVARTIYKHLDMIDGGKPLTLVIEFEDHLARRTRPLYTFIIRAQ